MDFNTVTSSLSNFFQESYSSITNASSKSALNALASYVPVAAAGVVGTAFLAHGYEKYKHPGRVSTKATRKEADQQRAQINAVKRDAKIEMVMGTILLCFCAYRASPLYAPPTDQTCNQNLKICEENRQAQHNYSSECHDKYNELRTRTSECYANNEKLRANNEELAAYNQKYYKLLTQPKCPAFPG